MIGLLFRIIKKIVMTIVMTVVGFVAVYLLDATGLVALGGPDHQDVIAMAHDIANKLNDLIAVLSQ